jgi:hypothetical protein
MPVMTAKLADGTHVCDRAHYSLEHRADAHTRMGLTLPEGGVGASFDPIGGAKRPSRPPNVRRDRTR